jgi:hypothetical protein
VALDETSRLRLIDADRVARDAVELLRGVRPVGAAAVARWIDDVDAVLSMLDEADQLAARVHVAREPGDAERHAHAALSRARTARDEALRRVFSMHQGERSIAEST